MLTLIKNIFEFTRPYKWLFILTTLLRILGEATKLYPSYAIASITTFFVSYKMGESLIPFWNIMGMFAVMVIVNFVANYFSSYIAFPLAEKIGIGAQIKAIKHVFSLDISWHEKENTGSKVKRIERGGEGVNLLIRMWFGSFIVNTISFLGILFIISSFDVTITIFTLLFLVAYFLISAFFVDSARNAKKIENLKDEEFSGLIFESVSNIRSVKVMSMTLPLVERLLKSGNELIELVRRRIFWYQSGGGVKGTLSQMFRILMICYIGYGITQGRYEVGFLVLFYGYSSKILDAVMDLADTSQEFAIRRQDVERMVDILNIKPVTDAEDGKISMPKDWQKINLNHVTFSYGDMKVLDDVNFTINRGEKIGVVGLSGAGKSTLFKLLLKERESYEGEILVDGVPLKSISKSDYFNHTAVVLQDTEVFNFSLRENITLSNFEKHEDEALLDQALTVAHVKDFAQNLPDGINTLIGEKGVKLSGGEKQRVGVARAIFKDPELLLLDEATSHLDVESEEKIQDSLHKFFKTVTAVVIAHRLTTIKEMDKILVMEGGKIIEQGSFAELHSMKGRFYDLWEKQKL